MIYEHWQTFFTQCVLINMLNFYFVIFYEFLKVDKCPQKGFLCHLGPLARVTQIMGYRVTLCSEHLQNTLGIPSPAYFFKADVMLAFS